MIDTNNIFLIAAVSFVVGYFGAWINFFTEYRKTCPLTLAACCGQFFDIFMFCFCGGFVAVVNCWPPADTKISISFLLIKALGSGFAFLSILEQFRKESIGKVIIKKGENEIGQSAKAAIEEAKALKNEDLKHLLKIASDLVNDKENPVPEKNDAI